MMKRPYCSGTYIKVASMLTLDEKHSEVAARVRTSTFVARGLRRVCATPTRGYTVT